jgi:hypothetical protein
MRRRVFHAGVIVSLVLAGCAAGTAAPAAPTPRPQQGALPTIEQKTQGMEKKDGLLPLYWDESEGKLWLEIPRQDMEVIYVESLPAGVGSNDIGLDRDQMGSTKLVKFHRVGRKVLMVQPNLEYRATSDNPAERRAVEDAFAKSVVWGFTVSARTDDRVLVDATDFLIRDAHGVVQTLRRTGQGTYHLDKSRSAIYLPRTKAFPRNTEMEATLTFEGNAQGRWIRSVTPTPDAVTVREHQSFVALPPPGFKPRRADPRVGYITVNWVNYAAPLGQPMEQRWIIRHRLQKKDPTAKISDPVKPIVYYLDPGVPEPVRSALLDGVGWWNQAFEAAGFRNAFQVKMLPDSADPMDVRYNMVNWVHRATRGWSYGGSVVDPRTGEIIKGNVLLGSLRVRQDYLIAEGLLSPYTNGDSVPPDMQKMALARIRQLGAHEVGHTLGLPHNYIASTQGRASVMDYPYMYVKLDANGKIDLSDAYATGIGAWDKVSIMYGYSEFPPGTNEDSALDAILHNAWSNGLTFLTDQDARPAGSAEPQTHLWDNGKDAAAELNRLMKVRRMALDRFGEAAIREGRPLATMEEALVPIYLFQRYQVQAASKTLGGLYYTYAMRGDGQKPLHRPSAAEQKEALDALLNTLDPAQLALPQGVLDKLPPRPFTYPATRELFNRYTGLVFDAVSPAAAAADITVSMILQPERAARLIEQHDFDPTLPGLAQVIDRLFDATYGIKPANGYQAEIERAVRRVVLQRLMDLAANADMPQVRAIASLELRQLRDRLTASARGADVADRAADLMNADDIGRFLDRPMAPEKLAQPVAPPPGDPIGSGRPAGPPPAPPLLD